MVIDAAKQGGRAGRKVSGETSRLGPRKPARVEKNVPEAHRQEHLRQRIEAHQALPEAKVPRHREYRPPRGEMEVDP